MNELTRITPEGTWVWNGAMWVCDPCQPNPPGPPSNPNCPPQGWPPPGCPPWWSGQNSPPWYPGANAGVSFGSTPPQNPVRGHFFYDGKSLWIWDGAAWDAVGGEAGASGTPPSVNPPSNPSPGQQWFNGSTLFVWDGQAWVPVAGTTTYVQATAPPAPNPGDLWWNGTQMFIWSGSVWNMVGPGAIVGPVPTTTIVFQLTQASSGDFAVGANWTPIPVTTLPQIDLDSGWNSTTHQYTPTKQGIYLFEVTMTAWAMPGYNMGWSLARNDLGTIDNSTDVVTSWLGGGGASEVFNTSGSGTKKMNGTTDYVRLFGFAAGGTSNSTLSPSATPLIKAILLP